MPRIVSHRTPTFEATQSGSSPQPSSPDSKILLSGSGFLTTGEAPPQTSPASIRLPMIPGWDVGDQQVPPPSSLRVAQDGATIGESGDQRLHRRGSNGTPTRSNRKVLSVGMVDGSKKRRGKKHDVLGSSLHSHLDNTQTPNQPPPPPPRESPLGTTRIQEGPISFNAKSESIRSRPSVPRTRSGLRLRQPDDTLDSTPRAFTRSHSFDGKTRRMYRGDSLSGSSSYQTNSVSNGFETNFTKQAENCYYYASSQAPTSCTKIAQQPGWSTCLLVTIVMCAAAYFANEHFRLQFAHKELVQAHEQNTRMIGDMQKASQKQRAYETNHYENMDLSSKIVGGLLDKVYEYSDSDSTYEQQKQLDKYALQVQSLEKTIQDMAKRQLQDAFPGFPAADVSTIETEVVVEGLSSPLIFSISHQQVPYTAWTWLDQVRKREWTNAQLSHVGDDDFIEVSTRIPSPEDNPSVGSSLDASLLNFREKSINGEDRFVLGLRNPHKGAEHGLILTIHLTQGSCGTLDEEEVCFGKVVGGFDSLRTLRARKEPVRIETIQVRQ